MPVSFRSFLLVVAVLLLSTNVSAWAPRLSSSSSTTAVRQAAGGLSKTGLLAARESPVNSQDENSSLSRLHSSRRSFVQKCATAAATVVAVAGVTTTLTGLPATATAAEGSKSNEDILNDFLPPTNLGAAPAAAATEQKSKNKWPGSAASPLPRLQSDDDEPSSTSLKESPSAAADSSDFQRALIQSQGQRQVDPRTHG